VVVEVALGDEAHLADVALERLLAVVLDPDVLVNTVKQKMFKTNLNNLRLQFELREIIPIILSSKFGTYAKKLQRRKCIETLLTFST
jgi:hypothetical protein